MNSTISISAAPSTLNSALETWQDWSDTTFDDQYREAILTLVAGLARLVGYLIGCAYCWLVLQCTKTTRYWLSEAVQAVPVLRGWWIAPSIEIEATQYPETAGRPLLLLSRKPFSTMNWTGRSPLNRYRLPSARPNASR